MWKQVTPPQQPQGGLQQPEKFVKSYVIDYNKMIGHGNFSHVYAAIDQRKPTIKLAVKVVNTRKLKEQNL